MKNVEIRQLASAVARDLFTNGAGERAQRLVLTIDGPPRRDLGGWAEGVVTDTIADALVEVLRRFNEGATPHD